MEPVGSFSLALNGYCIEQGQYLGSECNDRLVLPLSKSVQSATGPTQAIASRPIVGVEADVALLISMRSMLPFQI